MTRGKSGGRGRPAEDAGSFRQHVDLGGSLFGSLGGLGELVENLAKLAEKGQELRREGRIDLGGGSEGVFGVRVRTGLGGMRAERFGDLRSDADGPVVAEAREPLVDVFEESDGVRIVAELPGVAASEVEATVEGKRLQLGTTGERRYAKTIELGRTVDPGSLRKTLKNGILELRLRHG